MVCQPGSEKSKLRNRWNIAQDIDLVMIIQELLNKIGESIRR